MRAIVYRTRPAPKAALQQLYQLSEDVSASFVAPPEVPLSWTARPLPAPRLPEGAALLYYNSANADAPAAAGAGDSGSSITVIPSYATINPAVLAYLWSPNTDFAVAAEPETTPVQAARPLAQPRPITAAAALYYRGADTVTANDEVPMSWAPKALPGRKPATTYLFTTESADTNVETVRAWTPRPLQLTRPSTAYLFSSGPRDIGTEVPQSWTPSPLRLSAVRAAPLYLFNRTAQDDSVAAAPETPPSWQPPLRYAPAWAPVIAFSMGREETGPNPPVGEPQALGWQRPITFKPAWAPVVTFSGIKGDTPPPQPPSPSPWAARPLSVPTANLRAASLYYLHGTAEDFGEQPAAQFLVFWQYRTAYEDRVRQFFMRELQGQPPQDNDESAQPSTMVFWRTRGIQVPKVPLAAFANLYFTELAQDTSAPIQPETTVPWTAQRLGQNAVPKSAFSNLYFSNTAQDFDAPIEPETNPQQWTAQRVVQNPVPRAAFLNYYQGAEDIPIIPETTTRWQPRPLWDTPTPISAFLQLYLSHTAQDDNAPVATILQGWRPRPLVPYALPHYWLYMWEPANAQQSSADDIGRSGWVGTALRTSKVPRGAYLYYRSSTARDDNAPAPPPPPVGHGSEFPQWLRRARLLQYHP